MSRKIDVRSAHSPAVLANYRNQPKRILMRSWFVIDGRLPAIDYPGDSNCRYPEELVEQMVTLYSRPNDWGLDPFCGFGTTLSVCSRLNRSAVYSTMTTASAPSGSTAPVGMATHFPCEAATV